jgi:hypothetical protein
MDAQDFRSLQEAYMEVVENQQLDEGSNLPEKKPRKSKDLKSSSGPVGLKEVTQKRDAAAGRIMIVMSIQRVLVK